MTRPQSQTHSFTGPVSRRLAGRPSLSTVTCELLRPRLKSIIQPPSDPEHLALGHSLWRLEEGRQVFAGYGQQPLVNSVYRRYLTNTAPQLSIDVHFLTDQAGSEYPRQLTADLLKVAEEIDLAGRFVIDAWCERLVSYWSEPGPDGSSPWAWLAAHQQTLAIQALDQAKTNGELTTREVALVRQLLGRALADKVQVEARPSVKIHVLEEAERPLPLVLIETATPAPVWLLYEPQKGWLRFGANAALARHLGQAISPGDSQVGLAQLLSGPGVFTAWAGALLNVHLKRQRALATALKRKAVDPSTFEAAINAFPAAVLLDRLGRQVPTQAILEQLPAWLSQASDTDQLRYSLGLQKALRAQQNTNVSGFIAGIPTVEQYARAQLSEQIAKEHPEAPLKDVDDVQVTVFSRQDDALLSIAGGGGTITYDEQQLSLVDLSLLNTGGRPAGWLKVNARAGKVLPAWLDDESVLALVKAVDVGSRYLELLHKAFTQAPQASQRRQAFKSMVAAQVPLVALETKLRDPSFDEHGLALVRQTFTQEGTVPKPVVAQLALEATPGAMPDRVTGMFLLWDADSADSSLVLYAPLGPVPLRQFQNRHALLKAMTDEPQLQQAVLAWLSDSAQVRYRNGGLRAPHWLRFGLGSEFAPEPAVAPARIAPQIIASDPLDAFYDGVVQGISIAADRQTVSNEESFWRSARQLSWLVFNQLSPLFSGPAASAAWLVQVSHGLDERFNSVEQTGEGEAFDNDELILDLALALLTEGTTGALSEAAVSEPGNPTDSASAHPAHMAPVMDFSWATPQASLPAQMRQRLHAMAIEASQGLAAKVSTGPFRGLIPDGQRWIAQVDDQLFEVTPGEDGEARVVDLAHRDIPGPWLRRDETGRWRLDLRLRLRGGGPKRRIDQQRELNEQLRAKAEQYLRDIEQAYQQLRRSGREGEQAISDAIKANDLPTARARRAQEQQRLEDALQENQRLRSAYEAIGKKIPLPDYNKHLSTTLAAEINMCAYYLSLTREALVDSMQVNESVAIEGQDTTEMSPEQAKRWFTFLHEQSVGVAAAEQWRDRLEQRLRSLSDIPVFGPRMLELLKPKFTSFRTQVEYQVLRTYIQLSLLEEPMLADQAARESLHQAMTPLTLALNTHKALAADPSLSQAEEGELLDGVSSTYQAAEDTVQWLKQTLHPKYVTAQLDELIELIRAVREKAEARLSELMKDQGAAVSTSGASSSSSAARTGTGQRVIRTRNRGVLMASVRKAPERPTHEIAEVVSPLGQAVVARFSHDPQRGDWVQEALPRPEAEPGSASKEDVDRLIREADRRLESANRQLEQAPRLAKVTHIPVELEELMCGSARELQATAERIEHALTRINETDVAGPGYASAELKVRGLRDMAERLIREGRKLRIRLTKAALPTAARVRYLVEEGEVTIRRLGDRVALKGQGKRKDIVQEYAIEETGGPTLWYAHFHYPSLEAADAQYLAAHLKTVSQRFVGLNTQMAQAASNADVVKIYRSRIDPVAAKELFLVEQ